jgi:hypothetical protein
MKKALILLLFLSFSAYGNENLTLIPTKNSKDTECQRFQTFKWKTNRDDFEQFSLLDNDYLTISLLSKTEKTCFLVKYTPEQSPDIHLTITSKEIKILEMVGTFQSGNWFENSYQINKQAKVLKFRKSTPVTQ